ncbi:immunity 53 family protein [Streptomyces sp. RS10V-4]|uniref:Imm53 family immunity protein n=1 Tax=Streptomyces rhizoryzae TaxID=2932493 RepID=UPI00200695FC|nr:Imm53 family immunity protein [Streptomyces rhizoryzae]MCK7627472.1 immunity 53 family protein [Streptomyces rhizoryzae]
MSLDPLSALTAWYSRQCDGEWEHEYGIRIETLDNPGWSVEIDLDETALSGVTLDRTEVAEGASWLQAWSDGSVFHLRCGPADLGAAVERFGDFAARRGGEGRAS